MKRSPIPVLIESDNINQTMADDRNWDEFKKGQWPEKKRNVTLKEYLKKMLSDPSRSDELGVWVKLYGAKRLEEILEDKKEEGPIK